MFIHYRMSYPYYGQYKYKITIAYDWSKPQPEVRHELVVEKLKAHLDAGYTKNEDFKWTDSYNIYLRDADIFNELHALYPEDIQSVYMPAPGFEHLTGKNPRQTRILWYDKFPYKIVLKEVNRYSNSAEYIEIINWCDQNLRGNYKTSSGGNTLSLYFMNSFDALAVKLKYSDRAISTYVADADKAADKLKKRMKEAEQEYYEYLEGEGIDGKQESC